jgi:hypothetical protein
MVEGDDAGKGPPASVQSSTTEADAQPKQPPADVTQAETSNATATTADTPQRHSSAQSENPASDKALSSSLAATASRELEKPAQSKTPQPATGTSSGRIVYQASTVRKTILSFIFLILLPFFVSLPAMMIQRAMHQLWPNMVGFTIFAVAFALIMLLVLFELIHSIRARVAIGESAVRLTLPAARGMAIPKLFYKTREVPYSEIQAVETRREVYGGLIAPVMLRGARIVTKGGDKIPLGYVNEANVDPVMPVPQIAAEIARRAGLEVIDQGTVRRQVHKKLRGIRATDDGANPVSEAEIAALNRRHNTAMLVLCGCLFLLVSGGLMLDISKSDLDLGERAHQLVQSLMKSSPEVQQAGAPRR